MMKLINNQKKTPYLSKEIMTVKMIKKMMKQTPITSIIVNLLRETVGLKEDKVMHSEIWYRILTIPRVS